MCFSQKKQKNILKLYNNTNLKNKIIKSKDQLYLSRNNKKIENKSIEKKYDLTLKIKNLHQFDKNLLLNKDIIGFNSSRCAYQNINKILFSLKSNKKVNKSNSVKNIKNINSDNIKINNNPSIKKINYEKDENSNIDKISKKSISTNNNYEYIIKNEKENNKASIPYLSYLQSKEVKRPGKKKKSNRQIKFEKWLKNF